MAGFIFYIPGKDRNVTLAELHEAGLAYAFEVNRDIRAGAPSKALRAWASVVGARPTWAMVSISTPRRMARGAGGAGGLSLPKYT